MPFDADEFRTPGQLVRSLVEVRGWSQRVLAIVLGVEQPVISRIMADKRPVDADMALLLAEVFGIPAERFLELQKTYDLAKARLTARPDPRRAVRAHLFGQLPVAEMITRGWLDADDIKDVPRVELALAKFFEASTPDDIKVLPHAAKKTNVTGDATPSQIAWLYRVKQIANELVVPRYSPSAVRTAIEKLSSLLGAAEEARHAPRILSECGIRLILVESITGAKIDGACMWLNDMAPVIGMSIRHDRIDNFWFVLRHEIEHVLRGHGRKQAMIDAELEGERAGTGVDIPEEERLANEAAAEFCVPRAQLDRFISRKSPFFAERDILGFAKTLNLHPGLVAGQLQNRTGKFERFRNHLTKIRSVVTPSAAVDGWGDVFPIHA